MFLLHAFPTCVVVPPDGRRAVDDDDLTGVWMEMGHSDVGLQGEKCAR